MRRTKKAKRPPARTDADAAESLELKEQPGDETAAQPEEAPEEDELTRLKRELDELREKNLRLVAESQNLQKRAQRERQDALRYAEAEFARELLVILDDLERTQESAKSATDVQAVADGVRIVYEHFLKILSQHNIAPIEALGQQFDPGFHEAMLQQPTDQHEPGTVIEQLARGYTMHQRVLRPSRVVVAGPTPNDEPEQKHDQQLTTND